MASVDDSAPQFRDALPQAHGSSFYTQLVLRSFTRVMKLCKLFDGSFLKLIFVYSEANLDVGFSLGQLNTILCLLRKPCDRLFVQAC